METLSDKKVKFGIISKINISIVLFYYVATFINKNFVMIFSDIPLFTIFKFEIFRLFSGIHISEGLFECITNLFIIFSVLNHYENKEGTVKTIFSFFINVAILQIFILSIFLCINILYPIILSFKLKPLISIGISFLTKHILETEEKYILTYGNLRFNNRFLLLFFLISGLSLNIAEFKFDYIISIYYGFMICRFKKILSYTPNEEEILHFEKNENYKFFFSLNGWISVEECYFKTNCINNHDCEINTEIQCRPQPAKENRLNKISINEPVENLDCSDNTDPNLVVQTPLTFKPSDDEYIDLS
jgi:hypothetical protein